LLFVLLLAHRPEAITLSLLYLFNALWKLKPLARKIEGPVPVLKKGIIVNYGLSVGIDQLTRRIMPWRFD
jgi:hypothetical protein